MQKSLGERASFRGRGLSHRYDKSERDETGKKGKAVGEPEVEDGDSATKDGREGSGQEHVSGRLGFAIGEFGLFSKGRKRIEVQGCIGA